MSQPQPEITQGLAYVECWEHLWGQTVDAEDREYLESLAYRVRQLTPQQVMEAMRHVHERFQARGHGRPPARYLAGILSLREQEIVLGPASISGRRGTDLQRMGSMLRRRKVVR